jgi:N-acyl-L-homoserine lactone synthetase
MLELVQAGQVGKTHLLFDMHRLRKRVFKDRMGWDVSVDKNGLEVDQFDIPNAVYLLALDDQRKVIGNWRLLPSDGPTMIRDVWPQFLTSHDMPHDPHVWEASRFAVDSHLGNSTEGAAQINRATQEMFCGLTQLGILCGIREIHTMYDMRIARLLRRLDCEASEKSERLPIAGATAEVGAFQTDKDMLHRLQAATGIHEQLITPDMLPPILEDYYAQRFRSSRMGGLRTCTITAGIEECKM